MNRPVIAIVRRGIDAPAQARGAAGPARRPEARAAVRELLGDAPRRSDLLIEHLHKLQDRFGHLQRRPPRGARRGDEARAGRGVRGRDLLSPLRHRQGRRAPRRRRSRCACATACRARWPARRTCSRACRPARHRRARHRGAVHRPLRAGAGRRRRPEPGAARHRRHGRRRWSRRSRRATSRKASSTSPPTRPTAATRCCASASAASSTSTT